jgi:hypothetical protein
MLTSPAWLASHGGDLRRGTDGQTWYLTLGDQPQYALTAVPVAGQFGCAIRQTINGRRIESASRAATAEDAMQAGLEDLRQNLGW